MAQGDGRYELRHLAFEPALPPGEIFLLWQAGRTHSPLAAHAIEIAQSVAAGLTKVLTQLS